jgi:hypothetical protein
MKYCIDSCCLIDLGERHYPEHLAIFKPIWIKLYEGIDKREIISVDAVEVEVNSRADEWREAFMAKSRHMFHISQDIEVEFAAVIAEIESNSNFSINSHRKRFMSKADPWLIALARAQGDEATIVTSENKNLSQYGLRPVCDQLGVRNLNLLEFFQEYKIS